MMGMRTSVAAVATAALVALASAQFPPQEREGIKTLQSKFHPGVEISYKEPGICETTPGVKSYSGYVHLPPHSLNEKHENQSYPINTFFWFFEARKAPHNAPLSIWLNGGPGGSSLMGALSENGPCFVNKDSNSTYINPWSWNNDVNMLYIDQPNQVGFSYDTLTNITKSLDLTGLLDDNIAVLQDGEPIPQQNLTLLVGTTGSQDVSHTANTTQHAATALWHFAQTWFEEFPQYKPHDERISLYSESYGGRYSPKIVSYFLKQNEKIRSGEIQGPGTHYIHLDTVGIINGCIDFEDQTDAYIEFPWKNTYDVRVFNEDEYYYAKWRLNQQGGFRDSIRKCLAMEKDTDPNDHGDLKKVNDFCREVYDDVSNATTNVYQSKGKYGWYDVTHSLADPFPPPYLQGYLNQHWVQKALGVPVNHSAIAPAVWMAFHSTGDHTKGNQLGDLAYILDSGVKVHLLYGDRDYACNWIGGEASSLKVPFKYQKEFNQAGYAPLVVDGPPYVQSHGLTRQYGNFSFTRVYQAGHLVPSYQPEAAYGIFMRSLFNKDIATGMFDTAADGSYATTGPSDTWWMKSEVLPSQPGECYSLSPSSCSEEQKKWLAEGTAIVKDWIVVGNEGGAEKGEGKKFKGHGVEKVRGDGFQERLVDSDCP